MVGLDCPTKTSLARDYYAYTSDGAIEQSKLVSKYDPSGRLWYFQASYWYEQSGKTDKSSPYYKVPDGIDINNSLTFTYVPDQQNTDMIHLMIEIPVYDRDFSMRPTMMTVVFCDLPKKQHEKLLETIRKNPLNAEKFIQTAFGKVDNDEKTGIDSFTARRPVNNILLIDPSFLPELYPEIRSSNKAFSHKKISYRNRPKGEPDPYYTLKKTDYNMNAVEILRYPKALPEFE